MALRLDRPRAWFEDAIGAEARDDRHRDRPAAASAADRHDTAPVVRLRPERQERRPTGAGPEEPRRRRPTFSATNPMRLWVAGDSLVITPGYSIYRALDQNERGGVDRRRRRAGRHRVDPSRRLQLVSAQSTTGAEGAARHGGPLPSAGNDDHEYMTGAPKGVSMDGFGDRSGRRSTAGASVASWTSSTGPGRSSSGSGCRSPATEPSPAASGSSTRRPRLRRAATGNGRLRRHVFAALR